VHTGVRLGELLRVQVSDLTSGELKVQKQGKFGKTVYRQIPLSSRMQSIIPLLPDWGYAFLKAKGKPFKSAHEASILFNSIMRSICGQMKHEVLRVHDLRHTFAFIAAQNGADIGDLQLLMGHKDISQTMRYRGFVPSRAINAVASL
jgi:integrase/recombinase XerD